MWKNTERRLEGYAALNRTFEYKCIEVIYMFINPQRQVFHDKDILAHMRLFDFKTDYFLTIIKVLHR